jgi:hypothetical protein
VDLQQDLTARLLHTLCTQMVVKKLQPEAAWAKVRGELFDEGKGGKPGGVGGVGPSAGSGSGLARVGKKPGGGGLLGGGRPPPPPTPAALLERVGRMSFAANIGNKASVGARMANLKGTLFTSQSDLARRVAAAEAEHAVGTSFRHNRREKLAAELIARFDPALEHHCGAGFPAGDEEAAARHRVACVYRPIACFNEGCVAVFSARTEHEHDER